MDRIKREFQTETLPNFNFNNKNNIKLTESIKSSYYDLLKEIKKVDVKNTYFVSGGDPIHRSCSMIVYRNNNDELKKIVLHNKYNEKIDNIISHYYKINSTQ